MEVWNHVGSRAVVLIYASTCILACAAQQGVAEDVPRSAPGADEPPARNDHEPRGVARDFSLSALTLNALTLNALTLNALTLNAITINAITINGALLGDLHLGNLDAVDWAGDVDLNAIVLKGADDTLLTTLDGVLRNVDSKGDTVSTPFRKEDVPKGAVATARGLTITPSDEWLGFLCDSAPARHKVTATVLEGNELQSRTLSTQGEVNRYLTKYLFECAFVEKIQMPFDCGDRRYEVRGGIGVAGLFGQTGCGLECQRWVSACVLARVNPTGTPASLSLRTAGDAEGHFGPNDVLRAGAEESAEYRHQEGAFFGNILVGDCANESNPNYGSVDCQIARRLDGAAPRYSCIGDNYTVAEYQDGQLVGYPRYCTGDSGNELCGFTHTGFCSGKSYQASTSTQHEGARVCDRSAATGAYSACSAVHKDGQPAGVVDGLDMRYRQVLTVYLGPRTPTQQDLRKSDHAIRQAVFGARRGGGKSPYSESSSRSQR